MVDLIAVVLIIRLSVREYVVSAIFPRIDRHSRRLIDHTDRIALIIDVVLVPPAAYEGVRTDGPGHFGDISYLNRRSVKRAVHQDLAACRRNAPARGQIDIRQLLALIGATDREDRAAGAGAEEGPNIRGIVKREVTIWNQVDR